MPIRVPFDDGSWPATLSSILPRHTYYFLEWKEDEVLVHLEYDGCDDLIPTYPDPYEEAFGDGASM